MGASKLGYAMRGALLLALVAVLAGCPTRHQQYEAGPVIETFDVAAGCVLDVTNQAGTVSVRGWDDDSVSVTYTARVDIWYGTFYRLQDADAYLDEIEVTVTESNGEVTIAVETPADWPNFVTPSVDFDIRVPYDTDVDVDNDAGTVSIDSVQGDITVEVDAGDVDIDHPAEPVAAQRIACTVDAGSVEVLLPSTGAFVLDASVDVGTIAVDEAFGITVEPEDLVGATASGTVAGGGATVILVVNVGSIDIGAL